MSLDYKRTNLQAFIKNQTDKYKNYVGNFFAYVKYEVPVVHK